MGCSRLPPSASMAALVFGFLVLSGLPEFAAAVTRHYTFNVGALQILSIRMRIAELCSSFFFFFICI